MKEFYRGTSGYDAQEIVDAQAIDPSRLIERQSRYAPDFGVGIYMSASYLVAEYFAGLFYGEGQSGGPAILKIKLPRNRMEYSAFQGRVGEPTDNWSECRVPGLCALAASARIQRICYFHSSL